MLSHICTNLVFTQTKDALLYKFCIFESSMKMKIFILNRNVSTVPCFIAPLRSIQYFFWHTLQNKTRRSRKVKVVQKFCFTFPDNDFQFCHVCTSNVNTKVHRILSNSSPEQYNFGPKYSFYFESVVWKTTKKHQGWRKGRPINLLHLDYLKCFQGLHHLHCSSAHRHCLHNSENSQIYS